MGCDIHVYVEKYDHKTGHWEYVPGGEPSKCDDCEGTGLAPAHCATCGEALEEHTGEALFCHTALSRWEKVQPTCDNCSMTAVGPGYCEPYDSRFYTGRNYNLFAYLANVRGSSPDPEWTQDDRDMPDDPSEGVARAYAGWGNDGHSHGWYTLAELQQVNWRQNQFDSFARTVDRMARLGNPEDVRMVFWFDN